MENSFFRFWGIWFFVFLIQIGAGQGFQPTPADPFNKSAVKLQLPNPFEKKTPLILAGNGSQKLQWWIFQNSQKFQAGVSSTARMDSGRETDHIFINWQPAQPNYSSWGLDYRESSLYIPSNVREFLEYKMGRERYIPLASLTTAAYLAYLLYQKYGHLLAKNPQESIRGVVLEEDEIRVLQLLWRENGLTAEELYRRWRLEYPATPQVYEGIEKLLERLENKRFLNKKKRINSNTQYFAVLTRQEVISALNKEMMGLDVVNRPQRWQEIQRMKRWLAGVIEK